MRITRKACNTWKSGHSRKIFQKVDSEASEDANCRGCKVEGCKNRSRNNTVAERLPWSSQPNKTTLLRSISATDLSELWGGGSPGGSDRSRGSSTLFFHSRMVWEAAVVAICHFHPCQETRLPSSPAEHRDLCTQYCSSVRGTFEALNSYIHLQGMGWPALEKSTLEIPPTLCFWKTEVVKKRMKNQKYQHF